MSIPTTNIKLTDVRQVLNEPNYNLVNLCTSDNINMWAKYKPINVSGFPTDWWKQDNCGYTIPTWDGTNQAWTYTKPSSVFRLGDFRGYNHSEPPFIRMVNHDGTTFSTASGGGKLIFPFYLMGGGDALLISDVGTIASYYLACEVDNGSTTVWGVAEDGQIVIDFMDFGSPFSLPSWQNKTLTFKFFLSSAQKTFSDSEISHSRLALHYVAGECVTTQEVTITNTPVQAWELTVIGMRPNLSTGTWTEVTDMGLFIDEPALVTAGTLALRCLLTGTGSLSGTAYNINLFPTYFNTTYNVPMPSVMYDTSYNSISSVAASSGGTEFIIYDNFLNRNGAVIEVQEDDTDVISSFSFRYNTTSFAQLTKPFKNYT